jgi:hypothetical protein
MPATRASHRRPTRSLPALVVALLMAAGMAPTTSGADRLPERNGVEATTSAALAPSTPAALTAGSVNRTSVNLDATYAVNLAVRYADRAIRMKSDATITNTSGEAIDRIEFNTIAARLGAMRLDRVKVGSKVVNATVSDQTIVVPLGGILEPGATTQVEIIFHATLRATTGGSDWLFTRAGGVIDLYRVVPWVSLRHPFGRPNQGDPFVTPTAQRVDLVLITDRPMTVAINARRLSVSADGRTQTFTAANVRDIPMNLAPDFRVTRGTVNGVEVLVYTRPGRDAAALLADARRSLTEIARLLGPYPWPRFIVVGSPGGYPMEGPGTIWIPPAVAPSNLRYIVAHETAHQWAPGLVGNDQWADPFADEALADMVARYTVNLHRASQCATNRLDLPITLYSDACYYEQIYIQGGNWLNTLRTKMGNARYWAALRTYFAAHRFGLAGSRQLLDTLDRATPVDIAALAKPLFPSDY